LNVFNLWKLQRWIEIGRLNPNEVITLKHMRDTGLVGKGVKFGTKLLAAGYENFKIPIKIEVTTASEKAKAAIEAAGGQVHFKYLNKLNLRVHTKPWKFPVLPRLACPPKKWLAKHKSSLAPVYMLMPKVRDLLRIIDSDEMSNAVRHAKMEKLREQIEASRGVPNPNSTQPQKSKDKKQAAAEAKKTEDTKKDAKQKKDKSAAKAK
jgi:hypothetical protein